MNYKTKKHRAKLYRVAAEIIHNTTNEKLIDQILTSLGEKHLDSNFLDSRYCCDVITGLAEIKSYDLLKVESFPEFFLFCPVGIQQEGYTGWWEDFDRNVRCIALLLAAEICENE